MAFRKSEMVACCWLLRLLLLLKIRLLAVCVDVLRAVSHSLCSIDIGGRYRDRRARDSGSRGQ